MDCFSIIRIYVIYIRETFMCIYQTTEHHIQEIHDFYNHNIEKFRCHTITTDLN
jgi:hypothetical protein